jgi:hypothetical protein
MIAECSISDRDVIFLKTASSVSLDAFTYQPDASLVAVLAALALHIIVNSLLKWSMLFRKGNNTYLD